MTTGRAGHPHSSWRRPPACGVPWSPSGILQRPYERSSPPLRSGFERVNWDGYRDTLIRQLPALRLSILRSAARIVGLTVTGLELAGTRFRRSRTQGVDSVQIKISTRHGHLSERTQAKITSKLEKLPRFFERLSAIEVTIDLERRDAPGVDLRVSAEHKHDFVATNESDELMASIDKVVDKMEQQLRRYKEKVQDRHRGPGHKQQGVADTGTPERR